MAKTRLDVAMVERGLAESRQKAQAVVMAGQVYVDGRKVDKAGAPVGEEARIEVRGKALPYVSRGGLEAGKGRKLLAHRPKRGRLRRHRGLHGGIYRLYAAKRGKKSVCGGCGL